MKDRNDSMKKMCSHYLMQAYEMIAFVAITKWRTGYSIAGNITKLCYD